MRIGRFLLTAVITASAFTAMAAPQADKDKMDQFIDNLMGKMTLQEKIGQLNLPVSGEIVTGQAKSSDVAGKIRKGQVGGLFQCKRSGEYSGSPKDCRRAEPFENSFVVWYGCHSRI